MSDSKQMKITLVRSPIGRLKNHLACLNGLGLRRMHQSVVRQDTAAIRGMVSKVSYMVKVEEV